MNLFKGLLFLHGHLATLDAADFADAPPPARRQYGAGTAATDLAAPLGNAELSRRAFGPDRATRQRLPELGCVAGGCG